MSFYVIETDALCRRCGERHEYVTKMCAPLFFESYADATWLVHEAGIEGAAVREVDQIPPEVARYALYRDRRKGNLDFDGVR